METAIEILIEVVLFLIASYFIFYRSFLKEIGKQQAKIITAEELAQIEENVKQDFRTKIEDYKSKIGEQLTIKVERFVKIEELVMDLIKLQDFIRENMFWAENDEDFRKNKEDFNKLYKKADISRKLCALYLSDA